MSVVGAVVCRRLALRMIPCKIILAMSVILLAYLYPKFYPNSSDDSNGILEKIISSWQEQITRPAKGFTRVYAGCVLSDNIR